RKPARAIRDTAGGALLCGCAGAGWVVVAVMGLACGQSFQSANPVNIDAKVKRWGGQPMAEWGKYPSGQTCCLTPACLGKNSRTERHAKAAVAKKEVKRERTNFMDATTPPRPRTFGASGINTLFGIWLILAPFILPYTCLQVSMWNEIILRG